jgi:hypothetical protein
MQCPHCLVDFHDNAKFTYVGQDADGHWGVVAVACSKCKRHSLSVQRGSGYQLGPTPRSTVVALTGVKLYQRFYPKGTARAPVPKEVPAAIAEDFTEACLVLADSPKASAALSRRCLQHLLRHAAKVKPADLAIEIQQVLDSGVLPTDLAESIDAIRNVGNFSAHPQKSTASGEILPVEPQEAEWTLEVLEALFDFYFVRPAVLDAKRAALNAKLAAAGKPPMKK